MQEDRYFSLKGANKAVPRLNKLFDEIFLQRKKMIIFRSEMNWLEEFWGKSLKDGDNPDGERHTRMTAEVERIIVEITKKLEKIQALGCVVKDANEGVVDFYTHVNGKTAFLCWRYGEDEVRYWHALNRDEGRRQSVRKVNVDE